MLGWEKKGQIIYLHSRPTGFGLVEHEVFAWSILSKLKMLNNPNIDFWLLCKGSKLYLNLINWIGFYLLAGDCKGGDSCCSPDSKCKDGDGDCDSNRDCLSGLCEDNNCDTRRYPSFESADDCCVPTNGNVFYLKKGSICSA